MVELYDGVDRDDLLITWQKFFYFHPGFPMLTRRSVQRAIKEFLRQPVFWKYFDLRKRYRF